MHEPIYAAKAEDTGLWVYGFYHYREYIWHEKTVYRHYILPWNAQDSILIDPATLCIFSGMYDCNDDKIYSGAVIIDRDAELQGVVRYLTGEGRFVLDTVTGEQYNFVECFSTDFEIIGNIFDNPKLDCSQVLHSVTIGADYWDILHNIQVQEKYPVLHLAVFQNRKQFEPYRFEFALSLSQEAWMQYMRYTSDVSIGYLKNRQI